MKAPDSAGANKIKLISINQEKIHRTDTTAFAVYSSIPCLFFNRKSTMNKTVKKYSDKINSVLFIPTITLEEEAPVPRSCKPGRRDKIFDKTITASLSELARKNIHARITNTIVQTKPESVYKAVELNIFVLNF